MTIDELIQDSQNHSPIFQDLSNFRFGHLIVLHEDLESKTRSRKWICRCDCGSLISVFGGNLVVGNTTTCPCRKLEGYKRRISGCKSKTPEYKAWLEMKARCYNPKTTGYKNYGGRGICVFEAWINSFDRFLAVVGLKPSPYHSLDRINNNGNYEPENIRWATIEEQALNKRKVYTKRKYA